MEIDNGDFTENLTVDGIDVRTRSGDLADCRQGGAVGSDPDREKERRARRALSTGPATAPCPERELSPERSETGPVAVGEEPWSSDDGHQRIGFKTQHKRFWKTGCAR